MALSIASLVVLSYGAIALAFSVPVTSDMVAANHIADDAPQDGTRAVVAPITSGVNVPTHASGGAPAWLVVADRASVALPASSDGARLVQAIAYVSVLHNGAYATPTLNLTDLTRVDANGSVERFNATVNLDEVAGGQNGFIVKAAAAGEVEFVPAHQVVGEVARFESEAWVFGVVGAGTAGFVAPLVALVATARPTGKPGMPRAEKSGGLPGAACPECRRPLPGDASFCTRCGAWVGDNR